MYRMKVVIDKEWFSCAERASVGVLITLKTHATNEEIVVVGQCTCKEGTQVLSRDQLTPDWKVTVEEAERHFPAGCDVGGGVWMRVDNVEGKDEKESTIAHVTERIKDLKETSNLLDVINPAVLVTVSSESSGQFIIECYNMCIDDTGVELDQCEVVQQSVKEYLSQNTVMCRVRASFPLFVTPGDTTKSMLSLVKQIQSSSTMLYFPSCQALFSEATTTSATVKTTLSHQPSSKTKISIKNKSSLLMNKLIESHLAHTPAPPVAIEILENASPDVKDIDLPAAPVLKLSESLSEDFVKLDLPIDVLCLLSVDMPLCEAAACLKKSICAQVRAVGDATKWKANTVCSISIHHISLPNQHCPVTVTYPHTPFSQSVEPQDKPRMMTDDELLSIREQLHHLLCLPEGIPYLRIPRKSYCDHMEGSSEPAEWISSSLQLLHGPQIKNPHLAVKFNRVKDGVLAMVQGDYLYYHYMQEGFNDDGWGCAYRSLQTLWSWFLLQNFTDRVPPTHREIQETLVEVGDKEPSLIGSMEWIGSFEVSTCLNQLLQVQCRIHHCNSGANMASVGRVLLFHFQTQGTPVMIGGGVLAHTILGVDFSESSGEIQFLILDPHYTGREDLKTIIDKGWCGWKGVTFWNQTAHYNLCLPLRPAKTV